LKDPDRNVCPKLGSTARFIPRRCVACGIPPTPSALQMRALGVPQYQGAACGLATQPLREKRSIGVLRQPGIILSCAVPYLYISVTRSKGTDKLIHWPQRRSASACALSAVPVPVPVPVLERVSCRMLHLRSPELTARSCQLVEFFLLPMSGASSCVGLPAARVEPSRARVREIGAKDRTSYTV
jgi:hypothetical protein